VKNQLIETHPEQVMALVQGAARAGLWARENPVAAAEIAARYWNQPAELIRYVLETPRNRVIFDRFVPRNDEIQEIADLMARFGFSDHSGCSGLVDDRFARGVQLGGIDTAASIIAPAGQPPGDLACSTPGAAR
jgi:NitT/TauT family transport system substrate-binding protein